MPWNGSGVAQVTDGTFTGTAIWTQEKNAFNLVTAAHFDTYSADICGMLQNCLTLDAQTTATLIKLVPTSNANTGVINIGAVNFANMLGVTNVYVGNAGNFTAPTASLNVGVGNQALQSLTNLATHNVAIGAQALSANTSGQDNTCVGYQSGNGITTGLGNTVLGSQATAPPTGNANIAIGAGASTGTGSASGNICISTSSVLTSGSLNVLIGPGGNSNFGPTTGSQNVCLGYRCGLPSSTANGQLSIQNAIYGTGNTAQDSSVSTGKIGLYTTTPAYTLDVATGDIGITTAGKGLRVKEGSNAKQGTATLVAGTVTVANTSVTANSRIVLQGLGLNASTAVGELRVTTITVATSFVIRSLIPGGVTTQTGDLSTIFYEIFEPA